jgi:hypothetical protein
VSKPLKSDVVISEIIGEINTLLPQLGNFINQFNITVNESGVNVVTDSIGNMAIDVPKNITDIEANKISHKIGIIDRLITTRSQDISDLLQKGLDVESKIRLKDPDYISQLADKREEFKKLKSSFNH